MPTATEVARLLAKEFAFVVTDEEAGMKQAHRTALWIEGRPAKAFSGHHEEALAYAAKLRSLAPGEALAIAFGDDSTRTRRILVLPGDFIKFGYGSAEDEAASKDLVERCARALDCDVVVF